ncbi:Transposon Tf2-9 polyprotein [Labeo rohita]|uniref:Gypsy retrotransposon integrase-like protein 1 n=1 Tax=Labeo rohita TaxID=84645 RepID=A0ABQ8LK68_LABRO|nr:Transposon Tf2-9 polyprotein [Labeo rohita]
MPTLFLTTCISPLGSLRCSLVLAWFEELEELCGLIHQPICLPNGVPGVPPCYLKQSASLLSFCSEQNCSVGNRELLAIKLALEEWRHWLEGAAHQFTIITNQKNLQYLREARHLNPIQARWALFFTRFDFKITYRPGSKNVSADALSHQFSSDCPSEPEPISPILWDQDDNIQQATLQEPAPLECPEGKIYVPRSQRQSLLAAAHQSLGSGHPGSKRTLSLLQTRYWWPSMRQDTIRYVQSCSVCAMSTSPRQLPTGKLVPLPIPQRLWSHIGVDFVTDLPNSEDQWPDREKDPIAGTLPPGILSRGPTQLEQVPPMGRPPLFPWTEEPSNVPAVDHWFRESERVWDSAHHHLQWAVHQHKRFADARRRTTPTYQPGDQVWLPTHVCVCGDSQAS